MKAIVAASLILALAIALHGFLSGGRFTMERVKDQAVIRLDRWTGTVALCAHWDDDTFDCVSETESGRAKAS